MRLWLIRHGETDFNRERRCQGTSDLDLNETGVKQASAIARYMANISLTAVHSSPLKRAFQTAAAFAEPAGIEIKPEPGLMELDQGVFEGCKMEEMTRSHPDVIKDWIANPAETLLPGGESMRQLEKRAWEAILRISKSYPRDATIAAVSHNLAISTILCKVLSMDLNLFRKFRLSPAGLSRIDFTPLGPVLVSMNNTSHLEDSGS